MIRLTRPPKPEQLTPELEQALVAEYLATEKVVWDRKWLKDPLFAMSHEKCAYCERKLGSEEGVNKTLIFLTIANSTSNCFGKKTHPSSAQNFAIKWERS
jgi:hypothetical protein